MYGNNQVPPWLPKPPSAARGLPSLSSRHCPTTKLPWRRPIWVRSWLWPRAWTRTRTWTRTWSQAWQVSQKRKGLSRVFQQLLQQ
ncbi:uncharacterized protein LOC115061523 isoform X2 [Echeneis naucrates]|uniref:uncharacterized protein LOC115061523 isoform X2 n=1 Tax=Echeneis naucrates TaxID=173247 RepID=UPI001113B2DC|nr:uncharacterized protein LOC115061523 isoform X2 [Echeneis naucrates]